ncbi:MAG: lysophospholipid acyltransferase family protein [Anaerolineae bacterium]
MASYILYRLFGWFAPHIPPRLGYWVFARLGNLFYRLDAGGRQAVQDNLRHVLGPAVPAGVLDEKVRTTFRMQAYNYFDLFRLPAMSAEEVTARLNIEGWENLEAAIARGKGVVLVSAHCGNIDVVMQVLGMRGVNATLVAEHLKPEKLYRYVTSIRAGHGTTIIPVDGSLRVLFRALRAGGVVVLALDRDVTHSGVEIEFFGEPAVLPDGYARLARRTGSLIVPAFALRLPDHRLRVRLEPALDVPQTDDRAADVRGAMRKALSVAERYIAEHPEQWVMFLPIWRKGDQ